MRKPGGAGRPNDKITGFDPQCWCSLVYSRNLMESHKMVLKPTAGGSTSNHKESAMDDAYTFTTPLGNHTIIIDAKHANLVKPHQWTVSFQSNRSSWRVFGTDKNGKRIHLRTLLWPNLFANGNRFALTFKNGNFIDYRESNVIAETWGQMLNRCYGEKARTARKRESRDSIHTIALHGCKLRPASHGRCKDYLDCDHYEDCLFWVAEHTKWDGWRAEVIGA